MAGAPIEALRRVPLFADLDDDELAQVALLFKERHFKAGETVVMEGSDGAAFFLIESGAASVAVRGTERGNLGPGDHFGEIALLTGSERTATIVAQSELHCYGMTTWDFKPLVETNPGIAWKLLQSMASKLNP
jgi:CRP-like cAMP-binding protein